MGAFEHFPYTNFHELNLDWVLTTVKDCLTQLGSDEIKIKELDTKIANTTNDIEALKITVSLVNEELKKIENGNYVSLYLNSIINWIDSNLQTMVERIVKYVAFGIDSNGYFYADIPATWDFLSFDTDVVSSSPTYGHLILEW